MTSCPNSARPGHQFDYPKISSDAIRVEKLLVRRGGRDVLHGLSFQVNAGSVTGLLGPSGCGKTTLIRSVVGVQTIDGGSITVLGQPAGSRPLRRSVGYATQAAAVYRDLTIFENLDYFRRVLGASKADIKRVLAQTGLSEHANQMTGSLSGGELSRSSLAVALLGNPQLLLLDEPTADLDPVLRNDLWSLFHELASAGVTLFISSHVMDEATRCNRLLLMREGRILVDASPDGLREQTGVTNLEEAFLQVIKEGNRP